MPGWYIVARMNSSGKILALSAFLAVTAWANVQLMSCCWFSEKAASLIDHIETTVASPVENHSCCPGEKSNAASTQNNKSHSSVGCKQDATPAEITASLSPISFQHVLLATLTFSHIGSINASTPRSLDPILSASSSPPRYLSLQRILI